MLRLLVDSSVTLMMLNWHLQLHSGRHPLSAVNFCLLAFYRAWRPTWSVSTSWWTNRPSPAVPVSTSTRSCCSHCASFTASCWREGSFSCLDGMSFMASMTRTLKWVFFGGEGGAAWLCVCVCVCVSVCGCLCVACNGGQSSRCLSSYHLHSFTSRPFCDFLQNYQFLELRRNNLGIMTSQMSSSLTSEVVL